MNPLSADRQELTLRIEGMSCASCAARIEKALAKVPGVLEASVNLVTEQATVQAAQNVTTVSLQKAVSDAGYVAHAAEPPAASRSHAHVSDGGQVAASVALTLPLMLPMLLACVGITWTLNPGVQWLLASIVQFGLGARFYRAAALAMRAGAGNMDLLVALGTTATYGLSVYLLWRHGAQAAAHLYFEAGAVVITLVLLGKWLEARARHRTADAIRALSALRPATAWVQRNGTETQMPIEQVRVGDIVVVRPGDSIPVDGRVIEGRSHVDESLITGESLPVVKDTGAAVTAGAINADGRLLVRTSAIGAQTMLARIVRSVETAQAHKAPIQHIVDRVSAVFVPVVLVVAALTFAAWWMLDGDVEHALLCAVAVLVIACPCALGLATPTAILVGTGEAARQGILVRDMQALEMARSITVVAFDKTGTLTTGQPSLVAAVPTPGIERAQLLQWAAALQQASHHPLAHAVMTAAREEKLQVPPVQHARALPGRGVEGVIQGETLLLGSTRWLRERGVPPGDVSSSLATQCETLEHDGRTISWLVRCTAAQDELLGLLAFGDALKPSAREAIDRLHAMGLRTVLLSGDNRGSAEAAANALGIADARAEVLPMDKAEAVRQLGSNGDIVGFVGDGLNDAPALAAAACGFAMGGGADIAAETAGITLLRGDPRLVADALLLSRRTVAKIKQGLFWAFAYNVLGLPLAAMGLLSPMIAGAAMAASSVSVVLNALSLRRWRYPAVASAPTERTMKGTS